MTRLHHRLAHWGMPLAGLGMLVGMAADARQGGFALLLSLCTGLNPPGFIGMMRLHWLCLPYMHIGMTAACLLAAALPPSRTPGTTNAGRDLLIGLASSAWMILGMNLGSYLLLRSGFPIEQTGSTMSMPAAMLAGMAAAMLTWTRLGCYPGRRPAPPRPKRRPHYKALS